MNNNEMLRKINKHENKDIPEIREQLDKINDKKVNKSDLEVLETRMNNFTSLPEGSTSGDAELMDGRIGANGVTYSNIGSAIRGQYSELKADSIKYIENSSNISTEYSNLLSNISDNVIFVAYASDWNDLPNNSSYIFTNLKYSPNYSIQTAIHGSTGVTLNRITKVDGSVYRDWVKNALISDVETSIENLKKLSLTCSELNINDTNAEEICNMNADNLPNNKIYGLGLTDIVVENLPYNRGHIFTIGKMAERTVSDIQILITKTGKLLYRIYWASGWTNWEGQTQMLKVLGIGDSICYGMRNSNKGFIGDLGLEYKNSGISGATLSNKVTSVKNIPDQLIANTGFVPDVIISNGGVNDYYYGAILGEIPTSPVTNDEAAESLNRDTILGGIQYLFYKMITLYPKAQRFFLLTHKTTAKASNTNSTIVDWTVTKNIAGYTQTELFDAIKKVCNIYNVKIINIFDESIINTAFSQYKSSISYSDDNSVTNSEFVDKDGIHPLSYGYINGYVPIVKKALEIGTLK